MDYVCLNGEILPKKHVHLSIDNRAFRFGEGLVEEMRSSGIRIPFFQDHFERLSQALTSLGISYTSVFTSDSLRRSIELLIHRKKAYGVNKVSLYLWREDDKAQVTSKVNVEYLIEILPLEEKAFVHNKQGFVVDVFREAYKGKSFLSGFNTTSNMLKVMASFFAKKHNLDGALILNAEGNVVEEANANIFFANGKTIYTPALDSGCVAGICRKKILDIAEQEGYVIIETDALSPSFFRDVQEVFLANDVYGIRAVMGYEDKRYPMRLSALFVSKLNELFEA